MLPENFSEPHVFAPDRWLETEQKKDWIHTPAYNLAFGAGPRVCPGRSLSLFNLQLVLSMLAKDFYFELAKPNLEVAELFSFSMKPKNFEIIFSHRAQN